MWSELKNEKLEKRKLREIGSFFLVIIPFGNNFFW